MPFQHQELETIVDVDSNNAAYALPAAMRLSKLISLGSDEQRSALADQVSTMAKIFSENKSRFRCVLCRSNDVFPSFQR